MELETVSFCKYYKKLLIEDFYFNEDRVKLHYGKCSVIGLCVFAQNIYYLGNIRITTLSSDFQLPDDSYRILLLTHLCNEPLPIDKFVEILGETVLYDTTLPLTDEHSDHTHKLINSKDLMKMRTDVEQNDENIVKFNMVAMQRFRPAIKVHAFVVIENAHQIINYNLRLKKYRRKIVES